MEVSLQLPQLVFVVVEAASLSPWEAAGKLLELWLLLIKRECLASVVVLRSWLLL